MIKMVSDDTYEYRKKIGLPVTKKLYYKDYEGSYEIKSFYIVKEFDILDYWAILELKFDDHKPVKIHSMFLKEMQRKNFKRSEVFNNV